MAAGGAINLVSKTGSNRFEVEFNATMESNRLRFFMDQADSAAPTYFYVLAPAISGPIIKDRLWFAFATESHIIQQANDADPTGYFPQQAPYRKFIQKGTLKLSWQMTARNKLAILTNFDLPHEWNMRRTIGIDPEAQQDRQGVRLFWGVVWEALLTDALVFRSQVGYTMIPQHIYPASCKTNPIDCDHIPNIVQTYPRRQEWGNNNNHERQDLFSLQFKNRLEYFINSKTVGDHSLSLNEYFYTEEDIRGKAYPGDQIVELNGNVNSQKTTYFSNDPRVSAMPRFGWNFTSTTSYRHITTASDSWRPTRYLTFTPALSHIWATASNSSGTSILAQQAFAPSLAAVWDATHDGRTAIRAAASQYVDLIMESVARHSVGGHTALRCKWDDATQDYTKECEYSGGPSKNTVGLPCGPTGRDARGNRCGTNLDIPKTLEYTVGAERELIQGLSLSLDFVYRLFLHQYETSETNRVWLNSGTALERTGGYKNGRSESIMDLGTPDGARRTYQGATVGFKKREGRFKVIADYTLSKLYGNVYDTLTNAYGDIPPNDVYLYGALSDDHRHEVKVNLTYQVSRWLSTGARYSYMSGMPYSRLFRNDVTGSFQDRRSQIGTNPGNNLNDPSDDRELRLPDRMSMNLQTRANLEPLLGQKLDFYVDFLNLLALRTPTAVGQNDGQEFGLTTSRMSPFQIRLGLNYRY
jgi:hypothetical protein